MKHPCYCLKQIPEVEFDVFNIEHVKAVLQVKNEGRLHPTLRFAVSPPFTSAQTMAEHLMALQYARILTGEDIEDKFTAQSESITEKLRDRAPYPSASLSSSSEYQH